MAGMGVGTTAGVWVVSDASVGAVAVGKGKGVSVGSRGAEVGGGEERKGSRAEKGREQRKDAPREVLGHAGYFTRNEYF